MGRGIGNMLAEVIGLADNFAVFRVHHHGSDGHFVLFGGISGQRQRPFHKFYFQL